MPGFDETIPMPPGMTPESWSSVVAERQRLVVGSRSDRHMLRGLSVSEAYPSDDVVEASRADTFNMDPKQLCTYAVYRALDARD